MSEPQADRPYLRGTALTLVGCFNFIGPPKSEITKGIQWGVLLGKMIAAADTEGELLNYDNQMIVLATQSLMNSSPLEYFQKFVKSVARSKKLWESLVQTFAEQIPSVQQHLSQTKHARDISILDNLCQTYPDLRSARDKIKGAQGVIAEDPAPIFV